MTNTRLWLQHRGTRTQPTRTDCRLNAYSSDNRQQNRITHAQHLNLHCAITTPQEKKLGLLENKQSNRVNLHTSISDRENSRGFRATPILTANRDGCTANTSSVNLNDIFPPSPPTHTHTNSEECIERDGKFTEKKQEIQGTRTKFVALFFPSNKCRTKHRWI